jgi:LDH2 family malate/lactate/ureidoglycolate dehydrogenase
VLTGGQRADEPQRGGVLNSMLAVLIEARRLADPATLATGLAAVADNIHGARRAGGVTDILLPGEPELRALGERGVHGIPIPDGDWAALLGLARQEGVAETDLNGLLR